MRHAASLSSRRRAARAPSRATSRAGSPRASSQAGASAPRTTAAVLAVLAATQVRAATVTVRHGPSAGRPVRGSTRWCRSVPSTVHRRARVDEVASPPSYVRRLSPVASSGSRRGGRPAEPADGGQVAADGDERRAAGRPPDGGRGPVGGECLGGRAEVEHDARRARSAGSRPAARRARSRACSAGCRSGGQRGGPAGPYASGRRCRGRSRGRPGRRRASGRPGRR